MKKISIFTPCYNEEGNLENMVNAVRNIMKEYPAYEYEHVISDNCSTDQSINILRELTDEDNHVKVILNMRNFGPGRSGMHGLYQCSGDAVVCLACDFQDPPELIGKFIEEWEKGALVVWGQKTKSKESGMMFRVRTLYYKIVQAFSEVEQIEHITGMGLYDKSVLIELKKLNEPSPNLRHMIMDLGFPVTLLPYEQQLRASGKSSYNFWRYLDTAIQSVTATSTVPLRIASYIGVFLAFVSFIIGMVYLIMKLYRWDSFQMGMAPIVCGMFFLGAIQLIFIGILGEYIGTILAKVERKPLVVEKERINFDKNTNS